MPALTFSRSLRRTARCTSDAGLCLRTSGTTITTSMSPGRHQKPVPSQSLTRLTTLRMSDLSRHSKSPCLP